MYVPVVGKTWVSCSGLVPVSTVVMSDDYDPVVVVLDGKPFDIDAGDVDVRFASRRGPNAADDDIAAMAAEGDTVVTSDADLERRVRAKGAAVIGSSGFRRRLDD